MFILKACKAVLNTANVVLNSANGMVNSTVNSANGMINSANETVDAIIEKSSRSSMAMAVVDDHHVAELPRVVPGKCDFIAS